jgi:hypothetical protein
VITRCISARAGRDLVAFLLGVSALVVSDPAVTGELVVGGGGSPATPQTLTAKREK